MIPGVAEAMGVGRGMVYRAMSSQTAQRAGSLLTGYGPGSVAARTGMYTASGALGWGAVGAGAGFGIGMVPGGMSPMQGARRGALVGGVLGGAAVGAAALINRGIMGEVTRDAIAPAVGAFRQRMAMGSGMPGFRGGGI